MKIIESFEHRNTHMRRTRGDFPFMSTGILSDPIPGQPTPSPVCFINPRDVARKMLEGGQPYVAMQLLVLSKTELLSRN